MTATGRPFGIDGEDLMVTELRAMRVSYDPCAHLVQTQQPDLVLEHGSCLHTTTCGWCAKHTLTANPVNQADVKPLPPSHAMEIMGRSTTMTRKNATATLDAPETPAAPKTKRSSKKQQDQPDQPVETAAVVAEITEPASVASEALAEAQEEAKATVKSRYHRRPDGLAHNQHPEVQAMLHTSRKMYADAAKMRKARSEWNGDGPEPYTAEQEDAAYEEYREFNRKYREAARAAGETPLR